MNILLTNDDGYNHQGIHQFFDVLSKKHHVVMVAPDRDRSGCSHSITLGAPVQFIKKEEDKFTCNGTPVDCVLYSALGAIPFKPDLVLAGINRGSNLGTDLFYSGTAAAARQGAMYDYPSIAVSSALHRPPYQYELEAEIFLNQLDFILSQWEKGCFININFPEKLSLDTPWVHSHPAKREYSDHLDSYTSPLDGASWFFLSGTPIDKEHKDEGSDWGVVLEGKIAYSKVFIDI